MTTDNGRSDFGDTELYADDLPEDQREALRRYLAESEELK